MWSLTPALRERGKRVCLAPALTKPNVSDVETRTSVKVSKTRQLDCAYTAGCWLCMIVTDY